MMAFNANTTAAEAASALSSKIRGKTILVTGVSPNSLGEEVSRVIAHHQPRLIVLASRSKANTEQVRERLQKEVPDVKVRLEELDLSSQNSVRQAAERINAYKEPINVLINNAGIMATPFSRTPDGLESQFGTNHIGHFLFTNLIMPRILAAGEGARIVVISSLGHTWGPIHWDDYNFERDAYEPLAAYAQSKSANILFALSLADKLKPYGVLSFAVHPGIIMTNLFRDFPEDKLKEMQALVDSGEITFKTMQEGATTHIVAAFDPSIEASSGQYLADCKVVPVTVEWARGSENAERLWKLSQKIVGEEFKY